MSAMDGYSDFVVAPNETEAISRAAERFEQRRGKVPFETPLYVEDLGDGCWEVVLRARISARPTSRDDDPADESIIRLEDFLGRVGLRGRA